MRTPALEQLMGAYLHQDYDLEGDVWDNVDAFVVESPDLVPLLAAEVAWARATPTNGSSRSSCSPWAPRWSGPDEGGYRGWLSEIARRVGQAR